MCKRDGQSIGTFLEKNIGNVNRSKWSSGFQFLEGRTDCLSSKGYWVQVELFAIDSGAQFKGGAIICSKNQKIIKHCTFIQISSAQTTVRLTNARNIGRGTQFLIHIIIETANTVLTVEFKLFGGMILVNSRWACFYRTPILWFSSIFVQWLFL